MPCSKISYFTVSYLYPESMKLKIKTNYLNDVLWAAAFAALPENPPCPGNPPPWLKVLTVKKILNYLLNSSLLLIHLFFIGCPAILEHKMNSRFISALPLYLQIHWDCFKTLKLPLHHSLYLLKSLCASIGSWSWELLSKLWPGSAQGNNGK